MSGALDPRVAQLLAWSARARQPAWHEAGVDWARAAYEKAVLLLDVAPEPLFQVDDLDVDLPGRRLRMRRYVPREHGWTEPQPALLFFHGGGFTVGSLDTHDRVCRVLARAADCHVYALDYRLAPEHRFPAAVDDAFESLDWLFGQARALGVDPARMAVGGDSAGGTLAAATALHARDRGRTLALQLLVYPGVSHDQDTESHRRFASGFLLDAETVQWFFGHYLRGPEDRHDWRFAPLLAPSVAGTAPACVILADHDPLHDEGVRYVERLRAAGVPVDLHVHRGMIHAFFQHGGFVPRAREAHADAARALRTAFGHPPA